MKEKITDMICKVCQGWIIERSYIPYIPRINKDLIGPGSENVATERNRQVTGYYCGSCRIEYYKPKEA